MRIGILQRKKRKGRQRKKEPFTAWFPRLSAVAFVFCLFAFLTSDFPKLIQNSPFMFNFFFGVLILAIVILTWRKDKLAGISFILLGLLYGFVTWDSLLAVSTISTSFWLIATGFLFLVSGDNVKKTEVIVAHDHKISKES